MADQTSTPDLRDIAALVALHAMLTSPMVELTGDGGAHQLGTLAYAIADGMMSARTTTSHDGASQ